MKVGQTPIPGAYLIGNPNEPCAAPGQQTPLPGAFLLGNPYDFCIEPTPSPVPPVPPPIPPPVVSGCLTTVPEGVTDIDVQNFIAEGDWVKPAGKKWAVVTMIAPGGAGAGGAGINDPGDGEVGGGGGGSGGEKVMKAYLLSDLPSSVHVIPGAGGVRNSTRGSLQEGGHQSDGYEGTDGDVPSFGEISDAWYLTAIPGKHGAAGHTNATGDGGDAVGTGDCASGKGGGLHTTGTQKDSVHGAPGGGKGGGASGAFSPADLRPGEQGGNDGGLGGAVGFTVSGFDGEPGIDGPDLKTPGTAPGGGGSQGGGANEGGQHGGDGGAPGFPGAGGAGGGGASNGWHHGGLGSSGAGGAITVECY